MATINLYDPKEMTAALLESLPVRRFLTSTFFTEQVHGTKSFEIDLWKGSRRIAPFVHPKLAGKTQNRESFRTFEYTPPYLKPKKITTADDLLTRQPGEVIYMAAGQNSPVERASALLGRDMAELDDSIQRRIEAMAAEALFTGKVTVKGEGFDTVVDYDMAASHLLTLTGTALWSATATATIYKNLSDWKRVVAQDSGLTPTDVIMGTDAAAAFMSNPDLLKLLSTWNLSIGVINPVAMPDGVTFFGRLTGLGLNLWSYDEWYYDETSSAEVPMVPVNKVLVIARDLRAVIHYGVIQDVEAGSFASRVFVKSWIEPDPSARFLLVQSAPLAVVHQVDGLLVAQVL